MIKFVTYLPHLFKQIRQFDFTINNLNFKKENSFLFYENNSYQIKIENYYISYSDIESITLYKNIHFLVLKNKRIFPINQKMIKLMSYILYGISKTDLNLLKNFDEEEVSYYLTKIEKKSSNLDLYRFAKIELMNNISSDNVNFISFGNNNIYEAYTKKDIIKNEYPSFCNIIIDNPLLKKIEKNIKNNIHITTESQKEILIIVNDNTHDIEMYKKLKIKYIYPKYKNIY